MYPMAQMFDGVNFWWISWIKASSSKFSLSIFCINNFKCLYLYYLWLTRECIVIVFRLGVTKPWHLYLNTFSFKYIFHDIYRKQSDKIDIGTWSSTFDSYVATGCVQQRFAMQLNSNIRLSVPLINVITT